MAKPAARTGEGWAGMATDGFLTRSVRDTAVMLDACVGRDLGAPYDAPALKGTFRAALDRPPRALKIAICDTSLTGATVHPDCRAAVASHSPRSYTQQPHGCPNCFNAFRNRPASRQD